MMMRGRKRDDDDDHDNDNSKIINKTVANDLGLTRICHVRINLLWSV